MLPNLLLPPDQIALDVARALVYLHSRKIVHRECRAAACTVLRCAVLRGVPAASQG